MREVAIKIWHHRTEKNWTVEINGEPHPNVSIEWVHELVYRSLLDAEDSLMSDGEVLLQ
jgi:hypothetical protein